MKLNTKILLSFLLVLITFFILGTTNVNASSYEENLIKRIAPDGKNATIKTIKPQNASESDYILTNAVNVLLNEDNYGAYAYCNEDDLNSCSVTIYKNSNEENAFSKTYNINVTYDEPIQNKVVDSVVNNMKKFNENEIETYYQIKDLSLINYYMTSAKSELWNLGASGRALKYSEDIIKLSDGGDISFYLDTRGGDGGLMFESSFGQMSVFYNDYTYANMEQGICLKRVLYIPKDTQETTEAYINAAQKRINDYLGTDTDVVVTYGGSLDSLDDECKDESISKEITDGNYYNIKIKGKTYKFYIIKGSESDLEKPTYVGKNIETNIKITTDESIVPLDTHITVNSIKNENINKIIGTDKYKAFDIKLYSDSKKDWITKLENGKFLVSIPIDKQLEGKTVTTYYINSNNELEEYETVVKDGMATFETNHFSIYVLAEKNTTSNKQEETKTEETEKQPQEEQKQEESPKHILDDEPKTGVSSKILVITIISLSIVGSIVCRKKMYK